MSMQATESQRLHPATLPNKRFQTFRDTWTQPPLFYRQGNRSGAEGSVSFAQGHTVGVRDENRTVVSQFSSLSRTLSHLSSTTQCPPDWAQFHYISFSRALKITNSSCHVYKINRVLGFHVLIVQLGQITSPLVPYLPHL